MSLIYVIAIGRSRGKGSDKRKFGKNPKSCYICNMSYTPVIRTCDQCGRPYLAPHTVSRYCSPGCRSAWHNALRTSARRARVAQIRAERQIALDAQAARTGRPTPPDWHWPSLHIPDPLEDNLGQDVQGGPHSPQPAQPHASAQTGADGVHQHARVRETRATGGTRLPVRAELLTKTERLNQANSRAKCDPLTERERHIAVRERRGR